MSELRNVVIDRRYYESIFWQNDDSDILIDAMDEINLDSFEKSVLSDIKGIKPKSKKRGYAKELVKKLYSGIEQALADGCSYEEIAATFSNKKVKISPATLKRYHSANKANRSGKQSQNSIDIKSSNAKISQTSDTNQIDTISNPTSINRENNFSKLNVSSQSTESTVKPEAKPGQIPPVLTGASLTDDDYLDDFNDY